MGWHNTRWLGVLAAIILGVPGSLWAQQEPKVLLKPVDMAVTELNPKQASILDRIKKSPATIDVKVVRVEKDALDEPRTPLVVHLPGGKKLEMKDANVTKGDEHVKLDWKKGDEVAHLTVAGKSVVGMIYGHGKVYAVEPIGNGLQAVIQVDQSKYKDHPGDKGGKAGE